jgi:hypothetical protein
MQTYRVASLFLTISMACLGCASNSSGPRSHAVVQINNMNLAPQTAAVSGAKNSVIWTNWSSSVATVHFPASIASAFMCDELRPLFVKNGDRIESVQVLGDNESLSTPCALKPGNYSYEVWLSESRMDRENPQLKVKGQIQVSE